MGILLSDSTIPTSFPFTHQYRKSFSYHRKPIQAIGARSIYDNFAVIFKEHTTGMDIVVHCI